MQYEVSFDKLAQKDKDSYDIVDIRDEDSFEYGHILGAKNIPNDKILKNLDALPKNKELFLYCRVGTESAKVAEKLQQNGFLAYSLAGGYMGWLQKHINDTLTQDKQLRAEESIRNKFRRELLSKFCKALKQYKLVSPGDKIAVCISGGKDSMCMAKLFQEVKKHNKIPFDLEFLVMDPGYSKENREMVEQNAKMLGVPITIFETNIFENVYHIAKSPCYMCARMRRGSLYSKAKELGCNKIALGHHYDDVIETILMGVLYGAQVQTMMPKLHSNNFEGMELIRPMYLIREQDIKRWRDYNDLHFIQCACKMTESCGIDDSADNVGSKRKKVKNIIAKLSKEEQQIESNIFRSVEGVNLSTIISYKDKQGKLHSFLDDYDEA